MLLTDNISRICFITGYILLDSINSIEHTVYGIIRNVIGQVLGLKRKEHKIWGFLILLLFLFIMYGMSFNGASTIMFMISGIINLFAVMFLKEQGIRIGTTLAAVCNITAFLIVGSYASIAGETICGIMGVLSFIKNKEKKASISVVKEN